MRRVLGEEETARVRGRCSKEGDSDENGFIWELVWTCHVIEH